MTRPTWPEYFMRRAILTAERASCPRASVGAVLVGNNREIASGYNGAPEGIETCLDRGCVMHEGHCRSAVHAEANAIITAARHGVSTQGSTLYVTHFPCLTCLNLVIQAGVVQVFYLNDYRPTEAHEKLLPSYDYVMQLQDPAKREEDIVASLRRWQKGEQIESDYIDPFDPCGGP